MMNFRGQLPVCSQVIPHHSLIWSASQGTLYPCPVASHSFRHWMAPAAHCSVGAASDASTSQVTLLMVSVCTSPNSHQLPWFHFKGTPAVVFWETVSTPLCLAESWICRGGRRSPLTNEKTEMGETKNLVPLLQGQRSEAEFTLQMSLQDTVQPPSKELRLACPRLILPLPLLRDFSQEHFWVIPNTWILAPGKFKLT